MVVQYDLIVHQMDVKTAYLHAPIDYEIFVEQPEGFKTNKLVYRQNKYGLKQSGRNWNKMLHECLIRNDFIQNPADHCVYMKQNERLLIVSWVDNLIIAADKVISLSNVKKMLRSEFKMKDLGKLNHFMLKFTSVRNKCRARGYLPETIFCRGELSALRLLFYFFFFLLLQNK